MPSQSEWFTVIPQSDYRRMPWKNGLGETLEIALCKDNDEVLYRISQAAVVEDGVFSDFSGLHRTLVLIKGNGMILTHHSEQGASLQNDLLDVLSIAQFSGSDTTEATLTKGPIEDLNIMVKEGRVASEVKGIAAPCSFFTDSNEHALFSGFYANSDCSITVECVDRCSDKPSIFSVELCSQDTVIFHHAANITMKEGSGVAINITDAS